MIDGLSVLALITARGGSKGLPDKNLRPLAGRPLVAHSVAHALACPVIDRVVISSDDPRIIRAAVAAGAEAPFVRPAALATDSAGSVEVVLHALDALERPYDLLVLLQPTSPLRRPGDIEACLHRTIEAAAPGCLSVCEAAKSPWWMVTLDEAGCVHSLLPPVEAHRRQDLPPVYLPNGAVYVVRTGWLRAQRAFIGAGTRAHVMPAARSVDIDTALDFRLAEMLLDGD
jgi:N-acylneuraminate cytidylyltransferase